MFDFDEFLDALKKELIKIAKSTGEEIKDELLEDGKTFIEKSKADLQRWALLLAEDKITEDEFKYLVEAKKDLAEMEALKQKGLAEARIDKLKGALLNAVVGSALRVIR